MGSTNCHACLSGITSLASYLGNTNEPLGVCKNCSCLACGHHGHRDPNGPEYICVECDPKLLQASAASLAIPNHASQAILHQMELGYYRVLQGDETLFFESLEEFEARRPGYETGLFQEAREMRFPWERLPPDLYLTTQQMTDEGHLLLITALLIIIRHEFPMEQIDPLMKVMRSVYLQRNRYE